MSVFLRCQCGKDNLVDADQSAGVLACIRCGRPLPVEAAKPVTFDAHGRAVPATPEVNPTAHPAAALESAESSHSPREYLYWALPLALLPLAFALGQPPDDTEARFHRTINEAPPGVKHRIQQLERDPFATLDDLFDVLPGNKIIGAFAPRTTKIHWAFAGASVAVFLCLAMATFPHGGTKPVVLLVVGLFTATAGIMLLLMVQPFFMFTVHDVLDDTSDFTISLFGYILGVGLFEELAKLLPVIWRMRRGLMRWRAACLWGLASGAGFGVAEGIFYSEQFYNGVSTIDSYFVRFASCVALHAIWSASASLSLCALSRTVGDAQDKAVLAFVILRAIAVPAVLHGIYDVALQYQFDIAALIVALISFGWLACQIEATRAACQLSREPESSEASALRSEDSASRLNFSSTQ
jgi:RsiW-degrading membrane proteinase PrsW (M82 family)